MTAHTQQNRIAWNEIGRAREVKSVPGSFFVEGRHVFDEWEMQYAPMFVGKRVLQLQCASGAETLSLAVLGAAEVVGVDISDVAIDLAREKASEAGLDVRFVQADVLDLPEDFRRADFDVVLVTCGAVCWLPDIDAWASAVAAALRPGGHLLHWEIHPIYKLLEAGDRLEVAHDYFAQRTPLTATDLGVLARGAPSAETNVQFTWRIADLVNALIAAGMRIERIEETPYEGSEYHVDVPTYVLDQLRRLPVGLDVVAVRE